MCVQYNVHSFINILFNLSQTATIDNILPTLNKPTQNVLRGNDMHDTLMIVYRSFSLSIYQDIYWNCGIIIFKFHITKIRLFLLLKRQYNLTVDSDDPKFDTFSDKFTNEVEDSNSLKFTRQKENCSRI